MTDAAAATIDPGSPGGAAPQPTSGATGSAPSPSPPPAGDGGALKPTLATSQPAAGGVPQTAVTSPPVVPGSTTVGNITWPDAWRDVLAGDDAAAKERLARFADPSSIWRSYKEMEAKLSSRDTVPKLPGAESTPEQIAEYRKLAGIPDKPEEYKLELPKGVVPGEADKPILDAFTKAAHQANVTPKQLSSIVGLYYDLQDTQHVQQEAEDARFTAQSEEKLRQFWGKDFQRNIMMVNGLTAGAPAGVHDRLFGGRTSDGKTIGDDPEINQWLADLAFRANPLGAHVPPGTGDPMGSVNDQIKAIEAKMSSPDTNVRNEYWKSADMQQKYRDLITARMQATGASR